MVLAQFSVPKWPKSSSRPFSRGYHAAHTHSLSVAPSAALSPSTLFEGLPRTRRRTPDHEYLPSTASLTAHDYLDQIPPIKHERLPLMRISYSRHLQIQANEPKLWRVLLYVSGWAVATSNRHWLVLQWVPSCSIVFNYPAFGKSHPSSKLLLNWY